MKLVKILKENQEITFTPKQKKSFLEAISKFNEYGMSIYGTDKLKEAVKQITELIGTASSLTIKETEDWFDNVSVKRDMKALGESVKLFEKTANEMVGMQQRMESLYEDMGYKLGKYYEISEDEDFIDDKEAATKFAAMKDKDIDNDGEVDDQDSYLHHKLGVIAKMTEGRRTSNSRGIK